MSNTDKFVNEAFVDELLKSGVWDIARVDRGSRSDEELDEALLSERGGKKGDEGAGEAKEDDPDFSTKARKGDKSKTKKGKFDFKKKGNGDDEDDDNGDDDNGNGKNESVSAKELAEELINILSEDVILEFIDILYQSILNEEAKVEEEEEEKEDTEESEEEDSE